MKLTLRQLRIIDPPRETEIPLFPVRKFMVSEYHKLLKVGILRSGSPYELLKGWIVPKYRRGPPNASVSTSLMHRFWEIARDDQGIVGSRRPITFSDSEPEPTCSIVRGPIERYSKRHPRPNETELIVEVSDRSLHLDKGLKLAIYAAGRIPRYWIVNLIDCRVEVYTKPRGGKLPTYLQQKNYGVDESVPVIIAGRRRGQLPVRELLPGARSKHF